MELFIAGLAFGSALVMAAVNLIGHYHIWLPVIISTVIGILFLVLALS